MPISNQYPTVIYGVTNTGGLVPLGTLFVNNGGQLIISPSSGLAPGSFISNYNSVADLTAIPTAGVPSIADFLIVPVMNASATGKLDYYMLQYGPTGNYQPDDYDGDTNNVSWFQVL